MKYRPIKAIWQPSNQQRWVYSVVDYYDGIGVCREYFRTAVNRGERDIVARLHSCWRKQCRTLFEKQLCGDRYDPFREMGLITDCRELAPYVGLLFDESVNPLPMMEVLAWQC